MDGLAVVACRRPAAARLRGSLRPSSLACHAHPQCPVPCPCRPLRRSQLFARLIRQPVAFFDATETAQLTSRLAADCSVISRLFSTSINVAARNALQVAGGAAYLWRLSPRITGATAGVGAALVLVAGVYGAFTRRAQRIYQDALASSTATAEEAFSLSRLVRAFGTEGGTQARYEGTLRTLRHISIRQVGDAAAAGRVAAKGGPRPAARKTPTPRGVPTAANPLVQGVAYAMYVVSNNFLYNATRLATLTVGGAMAVAGTVSAEQLTVFCFYSGTMRRLRLLAGRCVVLLTPLVRRTAQPQHGQPAAAPRRTARPQLPPPGPACPLPRRVSGVGAAVCVRPVGAHHGGCGRIGARDGLPGRATRAAAVSRQGARRSRAGGRGLGRQGAQQQQQRRLRRRAQLAAGAAGRRVQLPVPPRYQAQPPWPVQLAPAPAPAPAPAGAQACSSNRRRPATCPARASQTLRRWTAWTC